MVDKRIIVLLQKHHWMTREELCEQLFICDRVLRDRIADINMADGPYKDIFIIGTSDKAGYRLARDEEDIKHYIKERKKRAEMILLPVKKAERILKEMESWTS